MASGNLSADATVLRGQGNRACRAGTRAPTGLVGSPAGNQPRRACSPAAMRQPAFRLRAPGRRSCRLLWFIAMLACLYGCSSEPPAALADGGSIRFSDLTGRWVIINYWAEWCAPCRDEIPELNELYARQFEQGELVESGNTAVVVHRSEAPAMVLGVNYDAVQGRQVDRPDRADGHSLSGTHRGSPPPLGLRAAGRAADHRHYRA